MEEQLQMFALEKSEDILKDWNSIKMIVQFDNAIKQLEIEMAINQQQGIPTDENKEALLKSLEINKELKRILSLNENGIQLEMMEMIIEQKKRWEDTNSISKKLKELESQLQQPEIKKLLLAHQLSIVTTFDQTKSAKSMYKATGIDQSCYSAEQYLHTEKPLVEEKRIQIENTKEYQDARRNFETKQFESYLDQLWNQSQGKPMSFITEWEQAIVELIENGTLPNLLPEVRIVQIIEKLKAKHCAFLGNRCLDYLRKKEQGEPLSEDFPSNVETERFYQKLAGVLNLAKQIEQYEESYKYRGVFIRNAKLFDLKDTPFSDTFLSNYNVLKSFFEESEKVEREKLEQLNQKFIDQDYCGQLRVILDPRNEEKYNTSWYALRNYLEMKLLPFLKKNNQNVEKEYQDNVDFYNDRYQKEELEKLQALLEIYGKESPFAQLDKLRDLQTIQAKQIYELTTKEQELERKVKRAIFLFEFLYDQRTEQTFRQYFEHIYRKEPKEIENENQLRRYEKLDRRLFEEVMRLFEEERHLTLSPTQDTKFSDIGKEKYQQIWDIFYEKYSEELKQLIQEIKVVFPEMTVVIDGEEQAEYSSLLVGEKNRSLNIHPSWVRTKKTTLEHSFLETAKEVDRISDNISNNKETVGCSKELLAKYMKDMNRPTLLEIRKYLQMSVPTVATSPEDYKVYIEILKKMEENSLKKAKTI